jgi:hypothetical protein
MLADTLVERRGESPPDGKEERHAIAIEAELSGRAGGLAPRTATGLGEPSGRGARQGAVAAGTTDRSHAGGRRRAGTGGER